MQQRRKTEDRMDPGLPTYIPIIASHTYYILHHITDLQQAIVVGLFKQELLWPTPCSGLEFGSMTGTTMYVRE